jgi:hypothetical protein
VYRRACGTADVAPGRMTAVDVEGGRSHRECGGGFMR